MSDAPLERKKSSASIKVGVTDRPLSALQSCAQVGNVVVDWSFMASQGDVGALSSVPGLDYQSQKGNDQNQTTAGSWTHWEVV
jgi:hypothetical protein